MVKRVSKSPNQSEEGSSTTEPMLRRMRVCSYVATVREVLPATELESGTLRTSA